MIKQIIKMIYKLGLRTTKLDINIWCGDGAPIVQSNGRGAVMNLLVRTYMSKAGSDARRGSDIETLQAQVTKSPDSPINIKSISNLKNLVLAYETIKSKPGNMTPGLDPETLDGISMRYLQNIQEELRAGKFKFSRLRTARMIHIPKPGKDEKRPLTIASPREKVIQKAIQQIMEPKYENIFVDSSHGFRPKKGTRTAIAYLEAKFQSAHYIIEADFSKAFPSIPHNNLLEILKEEIKCEKTISLIKSGLKAGFVDKGEIHESSQLGTPQGSVLSPLLCNIYLHKLDIFMEELAKEFNRGERRSKTKEYTSMSNKIRYWRNKGYDLSKPVEFQILLNQLISTPSMKHDEKYTRINYVRYADDFVIGVEGSYNQAKNILERVSEFVESSLQLKFNPDKTGITNYAENPVKFLGFSIAAPHLKGTIKPIETVTINGRKIQRRKKIRIRIHMDTRKVLNRLLTKKIINLRTSHKEHNKLVYRGTYMGNLINLDHEDILRYYNSVIRGLYNYYDFVDNRVDLMYIIWLIKESCASTLALKLKVKTISKIFNKFGKDLTCTIDNGREKKYISLIREKDLVKGSLKHIKNPDPIMNLEKSWNAKFTKSNLFKGCIICGTTEGVEMHHVKFIKDLRSKYSQLDFYTRQLRAMNRKQVPLCKAHHIGLHNNTWTEEEKKTFIKEARVTQRLSRLRGV